MQRGVSSFGISPRYRGAQYGSDEEETQLRSLSCFGRPAAQSNIAMRDVAPDSASWQRRYDCTIRIPDDRRPWYLTDESDESDYDQNVADQNTNPRQDPSSLQDHSLTSSSSSDPSTYSDDDSTSQFATPISPHFPTSDSQSQHHPSPRLLQSDCSCAIICLIAILFFLLIFEEPQSREPIFHEPVPLYDDFIAMINTYTVENLLFHTTTSKTQLSGISKIIYDMCQLAYDHGDVWDPITKNITWSRHREEFRGGPKRDTTLDVDIYELCSNSRQASLDAETAYNTALIQCLVHGTTDSINLVTALGQELYLDWVVQKGADEVQQSPGARGGLGCNGGDDREGGYEKPARHETRRRCNVRSEECAVSTQVFAHANQTKAVQQFHDIVQGSLSLNYQANRQGLTASLVDTLTSLSRALVRLDERVVTFLDMTEALAAMDIFGKPSKVDQYLQWLSSYLSDEQDDPSATLTTLTQNLHHARTNISAVAQSTRNLNNGIRETFDCENALKQYTTQLLTKPPHEWIFDRPKRHRPMNWQSSLQDCQSIRMKSQVNDTQWRIEVAELEGDDRIQVFVPEPEGVLRRLDFAMVNLTAFDEVMKQELREMGLIS